MPYSAAHDDRAASLGRLISATETETEPENETPSQTSPLDTSQRTLCKQNRKRKSKPIWPLVVLSVFNLVSHYDQMPQISSLALQVAPSNSINQINNHREIIVLNSTNFNSELIQYNRQFPHIKLLEYYLAYCGICLKFKPTYVQLAKEIYPWRNVIRASAIDLGVSSNTLIASSWSIDTIPTLRIHPPPSPAISAKLNKQMSLKMSSGVDDTTNVAEQLKVMSDSYKAANLDVGSLDVTKYTYNAKKDNLTDKVELLKLDLITYIERYSNEHPGELPSTWPNTRPVKEKNLRDLRQNHPRRELFLIVEAGGSMSRPSFGLRVILELSSAAAYKAVRYVRASENEDLIKDLITHKKKESSEQSTGAPVEQVELLSKLLEDKSAEQQDHVVLVHVVQRTKFPSIDVAFGTDSGEVERILELMVRFINKTYIEVQEDREFLTALSNFDANTSLLVPTKPQHVPYGFNYIIVIGISSLILIVLLRCASCYIERQRRHKAIILNGNGAHYSVELQQSR